MAVLLALTVAPPALAEVPPEGRPFSHGRIPCQDCHALITAGKGYEQQQLSVAVKCRECHDRGAEGSGLQRAFHGIPGRSCLNCHSFHESAVLTAGERQFEFSYGDARLAHHCRSCHITAGALPELSPGHIYAADFYHRDASALANLSPSEACLRCHSEGRGMELGAGPLDSPPRLIEHASHPYSIAIPRDDERFPSPDPRLLLFEGNIECQTCHRLTNLDEDYLVPFESKYALCLGCHRDR